MASKVCRAFCRPRLIHGIEWKTFYMLLLGCCMAGFVSIWSPRRLFLIPVIYFGPWTVFRWAGKHDAQWTSVYFKALGNRNVYLAGADPRHDDPAAPKVLFEHPRFNA